MRQNLENHATLRLATRPVVRVVVCLLSVVAIVIAAAVTGLPGSATATPRSVHAAHHTSATTSHRSHHKTKSTRKVVRVVQKQATLGNLAALGKNPALAGRMKGVSLATPSLGGSVKAPSTPSARLAPKQLKIMNYYPARTPWNAMWTSYNHAQIDSDMAAIAGLGANTVRIIVQPYAVGWPTVSSAGAADFADILATAAAHGLSTMLTLFDGWGTYDQGALSRQWMSSLLGNYANDPRIALIEVQNELPADRPGAVPWAQAALDYLHVIAPSIPRTISFTGSLTTSALANAWSDFPSRYVDVADAHLYGSYASIRNTLATVVSAAAGRPVVVGEAGVSTGTSTSSGAQEAQATFYRQVQRICARFGLPTFAPWILSDINGGPGEQQNFGLRTVDGTWKLAASTVRSMFNSAGARALSSAGSSVNLLDDPNFAYANPSVDSNSSIGAWTLTSLSNVGAAGSMAVESGRAGYLRGANADAGGWPALLQQTVLNGEQTLRLQASVRVISGTGTSRIGLWFYDANGNTVGYIDSAPAANGTTGWQTLSTTIAVPAGAFLVVSSLKSAGNSGTVEFTNVSLTSIG